MHGPLHHFPPGYMGLGRISTVHRVSTVFYSSHAGIGQWVLFFRFLLFLEGLSFSFFFCLWIMHLASVE